MGFELKKIDRGWQAIRKMAKQIAQRDNVAKAGVLGNETAEVHGKAPQPNRKDGEISNVELAMIHEYGAPAAHVPERSFIRSSFELNHSSYVALLAKLLPLVIAHKMEINKALGLIGARMAADMKNLITTEGGHPIPLAPETIKRKGSSLPLLDTGQLVNSITWAVTKDHK